MPIVLPLMAILLLYIPFIQDFAVQTASEQLSEALGMKIQVEEVRLKFPADIYIKNLDFSQKTSDSLSHSSSKLSGQIEELSTSLQLAPLINRRISLKDLDISKAKITYQYSLGVSHLSAKVKHLSLNALDCRLEQEQVILDIFTTKGLELNYSDQGSSQAEDSTQAPKWEVKSNIIKLLDSKVSITMPRDSLYLRTNLSHITLNNNHLELENKRFSFDKLALIAPKLSYAQDRGQSQTPYLDYRHIALQDIELDISDFRASAELTPSLAFKLNKFSLQERSGFRIKNFSTKAKINQEDLQLTDIKLRTQHSTLDGAIEVAWSMLSNLQTAKTNIHSELSLSPKDIYLLSGIRLSKLIEDVGGVNGVIAKPRSTEEWTAPIKASLQARGSLEDLQIQKCKLTWHKVINAQAQGKVSLLNKANKPSGDLSLRLLCQENAQSLLKLFLSDEALKRYNLPEGLDIRGDLSARGNRYQAKLRAKDHQSRLELKAIYQHHSGLSDVKLQLDSLNLKHFLPQDSLGIISGAIKFKTNSLDIKRPKKLQAQANIHLEQIEYKGKALKDITLEGQLNQGALSLALNSFNKGLDLSLLMDGLLHKDGLTTSLNLDVQDLDPYYWQLVAMPLSTKFRLQGELFSNLDLQHRLAVELSNINLKIDDKELTPEEIRLQAQTTQKACKAKLSSGDLLCELQLFSPLDSLQRQIDELLASADVLGEAMLSEKESLPYNIKSFLALAPEGELSLSMGKKNALRPYLAKFRVSADKAQVQLSNSQKTGLNGTVHISKIRQNALRIDSITAELKSLDWTLEDKEHLAIAVEVDKRAFRKQKPFRIEANMEGELGAGQLSMKVWGENEEKLQDISLETKWLGRQIRVEIPQEEIILAGHKLSVNADNFIQLSKVSKLVGGKLNLVGTKRDGLFLSAIDTIAGKQLGTIRLSQIDLASYLSPFAPEVGGLLSTELSYERTGELTALPMITGDLSINDLSYDGKDLGYFASALFYQPRNDSSHYLNAEISYEGEQSLSIDGIFRPMHPTKELECRIALMDFPLVLANPFISKFDIALMGKASGQLAIGGTLKKPSYNGAILSKEAGVDLKAYSSMFELDKQSIHINNGTILFNNYALLSQANPNNALYLNGSCNLVSPRGVKTNIKITADELLLFDTEEAKDEVQLLYGKLLASANLQLLGEGSALKLRGDLSVNSGTNCHYIMKDSPLKLTDNMSEVVTFSDFTDTLFRAEPLLLDGQESATDINIGIIIDPSVRFTVDLNAGGGDFLQTSGGGQLQLSSLPYEDIQLVGRYEMNGAGKLRYTMPVVGQKTFEIDPNSYISFDGDMLDPTLKLKANYNMKANVPDGDKSEKVSFVVSMKAENKLENLDLSFDLTAPESLKMQNDIRRMTKQERNKQALSLLTTGIYISKGNNNLNNALTALLESRLNAVTNSLLKGTDLSLGMELNDGSNGNSYTNYTYSFSKGFYDERLRFVIGGKVQVGNSNRSNREQTFIDNIALQYQLDKKAQRHLKLYYKRILDDILEGEHTETGLGFMMKHKLRRFSDLFHIFQKKKAKKKVNPVKVQDFSLPIEQGSSTDKETIIQSSH